MRYIRPVLFVFLLFLGIAQPNLTGDLLLPFSLVVPSSFALPYRAGLIGGLLAATVLLKRSGRYKEWWPIAFAFTVFSLALFIDWYLTVVFGTFPKTPTGIVEAMVLSTAKVVVPIVVFARVAGFSFSTLCLKKGNLRLGLGVGLIGLLVFLVVPFATGNALFGGKGSLQGMIPLLPLALVFALSNGLREELLYRGLFLSHYGPLFGRLPSNILQGLIFSWSHSPVTYTSDIVVFLAVLFPLSLAYGYLIQRTGALWGSVLIHAGGDVSIALGLFSGIS